MKKICRGFNRNRRIGKFAKNLSRKDRKRIYCRDCISFINKRYITSPIGIIKHKKSVDTWKKKNKAAIREYNKAYYRRKKHVILYNKKAREETEYVLIIDKLDDKKRVNKSCKEKLIQINPK